MADFNQQILAALKARAGGMFPLAPGTLDPNATQAVPTTGRLPTTGGGLTPSTLSTPSDTAGQAATLPTPPNLSDPSLRRTGIKSTLAEVGLGLLGGTKLAESYANAPRERAMQQYELDRQHSLDVSGEAEKAATAAHQKALADTELANANKVPVTLRDGSTAFVRQEDVAKLIGTQETNATRQGIVDTQQAGATERTGETVAGREKVADINQDTSAARNTSQEKIAQIRANSAEDVAKVRTQFGEGSLAWGTLDGKPVLYNNKTGQVSSMTSGLAPKETSQAQAMGEAAEVVGSMGPILKTQIDDLSSEIGPFSGRFDKAYVNRLGANDPKFAHLDEGLQLFASGVARAHFGARGGVSAANEFKKTLTEAQSVEDLKARIDAADDWMNAYAKRGTPPAAATPKAAAPTSSIPSFAQWKAAQGK